MDLEKEIIEFKEKIKAEFKKMKDDFSTLDDRVSFIEKEIKEAKEVKEKDGEGWWR